jgi:hypothetical protein
MVIIDINKFRNKEVLNEDIRDYEGANELARKLIQTYANDNARSEDAIPSPQDKAILDRYLTGFLNSVVFQYGLLTRGQPYSIEELITRWNNLSSFFVNSINSLYSYYVVNKFSSDIIERIEAIARNNLRDADNQLGLNTNAMDFLLRYVRNGVLRPIPYNLIFSRQEILNQNQADQANREVGIFGEDDDEDQPPQGGPPPPFERPPPSLGDPSSGGPSTEEPSFRTFNATLSSQTPAQRKAEAFIQQERQVEEAKLQKPRTMLPQEVKDTIKEDFGNISFAQGIDTVEYNNWKKYRIENTPDENKPNMKRFIKELEKSYREKNPIAEAKTTPKPKKGKKEKEKDTTPQPPQTLQTLPKSQSQTSMENYGTPTAEKPAVSLEADGMPKCKSKKGKGIGRHLDATDKIRSRVTKALPVFLPMLDAMEGKGVKIGKKAVKKAVKDASLGETPSGYTTSQSYGQKDSKKTVVASYAPKRQLKKRKVTGRGLEEDLAKMTVKELEEFAKDAGYDKYRSYKTKATLIKYIADAQDERMAELDRMPPPSLPPIVDKPPFISTSIKRPPTVDELSGLMKQLKIRKPKEKALKLRKEGKLAKAKAVEEDEEEMPKAVEPDRRTKQEIQEAIDKKPRTINLEIDLILDELKNKGTYNEWKSKHLENRPQSRQLIDFVENSIGGMPENEIDANSFRNSLKIGNGKKTKSKSKK